MMKARKAIVRKGPIGNAWQITFLGQGLWFEKTSRGSWEAAMVCVKERMKV